MPLPSRPEPWCAGDATRILVVGYLSGLAAYLLLIPLQWLFSGEPVEIRATGLHFVVSGQAALRGVIVAFAAGCGLIAAAKLCRDRDGRSAAGAIWVPAFLTALQRAAAGCLVISIAGLPVSGVAAKASGIDAAQSMNATSSLAGLYSLCLTTAACLCGLCAGVLVASRGPFCRIACWALMATLLGASGLVIGDKEQIGGAVLGLLLGWALFRNARGVSGYLIPITGVSLAMFGSGPVNLVKYWVFGYEFTWDQAAIPPSRLDPSTPFALTVSAFDSLRELGVSSFDATQLLLADLGVLVPRMFGISRGQIGAVAVAEELMGPAYFEGAGFGYSPYIEALAIGGLVGAFVVAFMQFLFMKLCVLTCHCVAGRPAGVAVALVLACISVLAQRMTMFGSIKAMAYAATIAIAGWVLGALIWRIEPRRGQRRALVWDQ